MKKVQIGSFHLGHTFHLSRCGGPGLVYMYHRFDGGRLLIHALCGYREVDVYVVRWPIFSRGSHAPLVERVDDSETKERIIMV